MQSYLMETQGGIMDHFTWVVQLGFRDNENILGEVNRLQI